MALTKSIAEYVSARVGSLRSAVYMVARKARLTAIDTSGVSARVGVKVNRFEAHEEVELLEPYGFTSSPPTGSKVLLLCSGGDGGHPIALLAGSPSVRLSGLGSGDVAIHVGNAAGTGARIVLRATGDIEVEPGPAGVVRVVPNAAALPALAVARRTDPVAVTSAALLTLKQAVTAWAPVAGDGGAALKTILGTFIALSDSAVVQGTGTITAGGTGMVST